MWTHETGIDTSVTVARLWQFFCDVPEWKTWNAGIEQRGRASMSAITREIVENPRPYQTVGASSQMHLACGCKQPDQMRRPSAFAGVYYLFLSESTIRWLEPQQNLKCERHADGKNNDGTRSACGP